MSDTDRLAALLATTGLHPIEETYELAAARLAAAGVFVLTVDRLAAALPDVMDQESADYVYGQGFDPLDAPQEWYTTPRELAAEIIANLNVAPIVARDGGNG